MGKAVSERRCGMDPFLNSGDGDEGGKRGSNKMGLDDAFLELGWGLDAW